MHKNDVETAVLLREELWDLFPIFLVRHDDRWNEYFKEIEGTITDLLTDHPDRAEWICQNVR